MLGFIGQQIFESGGEIFGVLTLETYQLVELGVAELVAQKVTGNELPRWRLQAFIVKKIPAS